MKKAKKLTFFLIAIGFLFLKSTAFSQQQKAMLPGPNLTGFEKHFKLIPAPQKIEFIKGKGISGHSLRSFYLKGKALKPVVQGVLQSLPLSSQEGPGVIVLSISHTNTGPASREGYILEGGNNRVTIEARDQAGLFYGCQTLLQLLEDAHDQQVAIPAFRITDYPDIDYRAIHLDLKHHLDVSGYYYDMMDRLAAVKINAVIIEFEDKLRYKAAPLVAAGNAISVEEFAAISRYAKDRNIEVSPLIQGLGHASFILKHEKYKELRDTLSSDWSFDPMNPQTYELQFSLYKDAIAATPYGKYLHVGGDEVGNLGMSELSKKSGLSPMQLQMRWLNKVSEFAVQHNRIPIFWDDMVFKLSNLYQTTWDPQVKADEVKKTWAENKHKLEENISLFPTQCVFMRWNYDSPDIPGNLMALDWYKSHSFKVMAATAAQTMWPLLPRQQSNFQSIKDFSRITAEKKLDGILCTAWDDCSPHFEMYWRGFYNFAFFTWHYAEVKVADLQSMFRHRFYAPALNGPSFNFEDQLEEALPFWEKALVKKGTRENYPATFDLADLPDPSKKNVWSNAYKSRIGQANTEVLRYAKTKDRIKQSMGLARRNQYSLEIMNQVNELQIYSSRLLLLLDKFDRAASETSQQAVKEEIKKQVNDFSEIRKNYETVFSKTRLLANPADYIPDQNHHHHLANGTNNSDWMYVYELAMNKKIISWLSTL
ncbi:MAG: glycoside hydrolase family 20 zincin-like fold domain-containing protein [Ferruginibacter sp.]